MCGGGGGVGRGINQLFTCLIHQLRINDLHFLIDSYFHYLIFLQWSSRNLLADK